MRLLRLFIDPGCLRWFLRDSLVLGNYNPWANLNLRFSSFLGVVGQSIVILMSTCFVRRSRPQFLNQGLL